MRNTLRDIWYDYRSEVVFGLVLSALLVASAWFSHLIPVEIFDRFINPALSIALAAICFFGGWLCLRSMPPAPPSVQSVTCIIGAN